MSHSRWSGAAPRHSNDSSSTANMDGASLNYVHRSPTRNSIDEQSVNAHSTHSEDSNDNSSAQNRRAQLAQHRSSLGPRKYAAATNASTSFVNGPQGYHSSNQPSTSGQSSSNEQTFQQTREKFIAAVESNQLMVMDSATVVKKIPIVVINDILELSLDSGVQEFKTDESKIPIRGLSQEMKINFIKQMYDAIVSFIPSLHHSPILNSSHHVLNH